MMRHKGCPVPSHLDAALSRLAASAAAPPVVQWQGDRELLAWRAWRLAILLDQDMSCGSHSPEGRGGQGVRTGLRLLSLSAPCIWDGPAIGADVAVSVSPGQPSGIYALKRETAERVTWRFTEHCWVTGWVALSGRVVEHTLGYRAECAVIRELRLGVGTHLAVRKLDMLRNVIERLEERYQAPVDAGQGEREVAERMLAQGFKPECPDLPLMFLQPPWWIPLKG